MTKYLRFPCKFMSCSGETPTGNYSNVFFFILDKNNERPDWMTDLKHTDCMVKRCMYKKSVIFIHLFDSGILLIIDLNKKQGGKRGW